MEKQRQTKLLSIAALLVGILGLTLGFAAFSNTLVISSSANVKPDASSFSVLFSSSNTTQATASITGVGTNSATGGAASISGTTISGLKANFTEPGQTVTYTFYSHNAGSYIAYLRSINFGTGKSCVKTATTTTDSLVQAACDDITVSVSVGGYNATGDATVSGHSLGVDKYETVVVTITYAENGDRADGEFNITFGDITLEYSSVDGASNVITFTVDGVSYQASTGMDWASWVGTSYNTSGIYIESGGVCTASGNSINSASSEKIENGKAYTINGVCPT